MDGIWRRRRHQYENDRQDRQGRRIVPDRRGQRNNDNHPAGQAHPPRRGQDPRTGRSAQGVTLIRCGDDDLVTSASLLAAEEDEIEE